MEFLHPAMWHNHDLELIISPGDCTLQYGTWHWDHDIKFARWQHPAVWHMALRSWQWIHEVAAPCNVTRGSGMICHWIRPVTAPCNVAGGSGMTCPWIHPNVRHIGILLLVSILTISPQSTCPNQHFIIYFVWNFHSNWLLLWQAELTFIRKYWYH